jgi:hypothetical protein
MIKKVSVLLLVLGCVTPLGAAGRDGHDGTDRPESLAKFDGGIGVLPVSNVVVNATTGAITVNRNIVRGVNPAGQIWVISGLKANISTDGHIRVRGRGLLLGGGNAIGQTANQSVFATLICEAAAPFTELNTSAAGVPLDPNGDFRIDDTLTPTASECQSPALLIRSAGNRAWFAAGIPSLDRDDD